jgi:acyl carrier protein
MINIEEVVLESYKRVVPESILENMIPSLDMSIGRNSGLDSLGIVNFLVEIEEALNISLDSVLTDIRHSRKMSEIVSLIEKAYTESQA